ncbi:MAG TPA: hypothetical protein VE398_10765 [Acidobacteriota bacterium]|nr:hypothetical protein [Acidobacteriota bacterium]
MKTGIIIAALIVVLRVVLEQAGVSDKANMIFGVAWLYFLLPVCFALRIASSHEASPFKGLLLDVLLFGVYTRLMVMATYMIAFVLKWHSPRFTPQMGGNVGDNINFVNGFFLIPLRNAVIWVVMVTVIGMIIGGITLAIARKSSQAASA